MVDVNGDKPMPPASVSKMMTEMIVLDCISSREISWNERVPISVYASTVDGRKLSLEPGEIYSVRELFEAIVVYSANDAAVNCLIMDFIGGYHIMRESNI